MAYIAPRSLEESGRTY